jgi:mannose-6-phosphate isomerase-like protein (cupin superfamily)
MLKISKTKAVKYGRKGLTGYNYELPDIDGGTTVLYAELTGEHGERTIGDKARVYFILEGTAKFIVDGKKFNVKPSDVIPVKPHSTYNYFPTSPILKVIAFMELLDIGKLPNK